MRYFAELSYQGAAYSGWQVQPGQATVQGTIEHALGLLLGQAIPIVGCGRTDTGVHAKQYFIHFDTPTPLFDGFQRRINKLLPADIAIHRFLEVADEAHARFDASHRAYEYHIDFHKNPFGGSLRYYYPFREWPDPDRMRAAANLLLQYEAFFPFCKAHSDAKTMRCDLRRAEWIGQPEVGNMVLHVASDRFLRGMIRLIVGMCLNVGIGKLQLEEVRQALEQQTRLERSWSIGPEGLYLSEIRYPFLVPTVDG